MHGYLPSSPFLLRFLLLPGVQANSIGASWILHLGLIKCHGNITCAVLLSFIIFGGVKGSPVLAVWSFRLWRSAILLACVIIAINITELRV